MEGPALGISFRTSGHRAAGPVSALDASGSHTLVFLLHADETDVHRCLCLIQQESTQAASSGPGALERPMHLYIFSVSTCSRGM